VQGFVLYLLSTAFFVVYLVWLVVPGDILDSYGVSFLPQRYWAVAVPIYVSVAFATFVFIVYPSLGLLTTPPLQNGDLRNIADGHTVFNEDSFLSASKITAATLDAEPIAKVCDVHPECVLSSPIKT